MQIKHTLDEYVDKFGPEFKSQMDNDKRLIFSNILVDLSRRLGITNIISEAEDAGVPLIDILNAFYSIGFYNGIEYGMNKMEDTEISDMDMLTKHIDEMADEFNNGNHYTEEELAKLQKMDEESYDEYSDYY